MIVIRSLQFLEYLYRSDAFCKRLTVYALLKLHINYWVLNIERFNQG